MARSWTAGSSYCPTPCPRKCRTRRGRMSSHSQTDPRQAQPWRQMLKAELRDAARHSFVSEIHQARRHLRIDNGLLTGNKGSLAIGGIGRRRLDVPAQPKIERQLLGDPVVILHK